MRAREAARNRLIFGDDFITEEESQVEEPETEKSDWSCSSFVSSSSEDSMQDTHNQTGKRNLLSDIVDETGKSNMLNLKKVPVMTPATSVYSRSRRSKGSFKLPFNPLRYLAEILSLAVDKKSEVTEKSN